MAAPAGRAALSPETPDIGIRNISQGEDRAQEAGSCHDGTGEQHAQDEQEYADGQNDDLDLQFTALPPPFFLLDHIRPLPLPAQKMAWHDLLH